MHHSTLRSASSRSRRVRRSLARSHETLDAVAGVRPDPSHAENPTAQNAVRHLVVSRRPGVSSLVATVVRIFTSGRASVETARGRL